MTDGFFKYNQLCVSGLIRKSIMCRLVQTILFLFFWRSRKKLLALTLELLVNI